MKIKSGYSVRQIAGENVVIMQGRYGVDMTRVIAFNDSALLLWNELCDKEFELKDVVAVLLKNYEVSHSQAEVDSQKWIDTLKECKLVE